MHRNAIPSRQADTLFHIILDSAIAQRKTSGVYAEGCKACAIEQWEGCEFRGSLVLWLFIPFSFS